MNGREQEYSLYFHIPFCTKKCDYCHFYVIPDQEKLHKRYIATLEKEWQLRPRSIKSHRLRSIYFGGGTPSLLSPSLIASILSWIDHDLSHIEITLEANPEFFTLDLARGFREVGINRLSIGIQSFNPEDLKNLSRTHNAKQGIQAVEYAKAAGFDNISIDLMYDLPSQSLKNWQENLNIAFSLPITHLSLYNLTIEPHTPFWKRRNILEKQMPEEKLSLRFLEEAIEASDKNNFQRYEISAFSKQNYASCHNMGYWTGRPFLGFGPSAFSYLEGRRFRTCSNFLRWIKKVEEGNEIHDFEETLSKENQQKELLALHLRLLQGFSLDKFIESWGLIPKEILDLFETWIEKGWLTKHNDLFFLTKEGALFYDTLASEII